MTYRPKSEFLTVMIQRGYLADCTDLQGLDDAMIAGPVTAYIGYDATAASLHVGHLLNIMMLRWLQKTGHRPITLMGGGTTKVGDPTGKDASRPQLTDAAIQANIASIKTVFEKFLTFGEAFEAGILRRLDARIAQYEKPFVAVMDGIVMGGGVGVGLRQGRRPDDEALAVVGGGSVEDIGQGQA